MFTPLSIAVLGALPPQIAPKAAAFNSLSLQLGGSFSTAALITLLARRTALHQDVLSQHITHGNIALQNLLAHHGSLGQVYATVVAQASTMAYADAQLALGALTFVLMPLILILPKRRKDVGKIEIPAE
ncbi:MAG: hypothetical protein NVS2B17_22540 [Candidatus Velthaea sp.]